jgi:hypothetical protein
VETIDVRRQKVPVESGGATELVNSTGAYVVDGGKAFDDDKALDGQKASDGKKVLDETHWMNRGLKLGMHAAAVIYMQVFGTQFDRGYVHV